MTGEDKASLTAGTTEGKNDGKASDLILLLFLFLLAMAVRCLYNYCFSHPNNFAACDAFEYISNGQALLHIFSQPAGFWQKCLSCLCGAAGSADWQQVRNALLPLKDFYISGPVFPAFLALIAALCGGTVSNVHYLWQALLAGNSLVSALSCTLIALIAYEAFGKRCAFVAGLLAAFYPGFIVNSGRLYSETFATFLLLALTYITLLGFRSGRGTILMLASGFLAASLQLTRSIMVVLTLALIPITALQQKGISRLCFLLPFALGFMLVALPWLGFQKLAFGTSSLVVDRVGHYNFFVGNNVDTQGWLSYPYPDGRNVEAATFPQLMQSAVKKSPYRWVRLMLDKPLRLFAFPWNDFRTPIGSFNFFWQVIYHKIILLFALPGLALALLMSPAESPSRRALYCRLFLSGLLAFHFVYCLFITVPRYNLTGMPEIIIFSASGLVLLYEMCRKQGGLLITLVMAATLLLLFIIVNSNLLPFIVFAGASFDTAWVIQAIIRACCVLAVVLLMILSSRLLNGPRRISQALACVIGVVLLPWLLIPVRANGRNLEWYQDLNLSSAPMHQTVRLPLAICKRNPAGLFLLVDTSVVRQHVDGFDLTVNGEHMTGPILPGMAFAENFDRFLPLNSGAVQREGERIWELLTDSAGCSSLDLRQWCMVPLPEALISAAVERAGREHSGSAVLELSLKNLADIPLRVYGSYDGRGRERTFPSIALYSWEKAFYGVENCEGLTDTRYDIKVPAATLVPSSRDLSDVPGLQNGVLNIAVLVSPPAAGSNSGLILKTHRDLGEAVVGSKDRVDKLSVSLNETAFTSDSLWVICLRGRSRVLEGSGCPAAEFAVNYLNESGGKLSYRSAWIPRRLSASKEWKDFEIVVPVKPLVENTRASEAVVNLEVASPDSLYLNILRPFDGRVEFSGLTLDIYQMPCNPVGLGHQVL